MGLISFAIFCVLLVVALIHLAWAFGMAWPARSRAELGAMVVGTPSGVPMPSAALTLIVAGAIMVLGIVALWGANVFSLGALDGLRRWVLLGVMAIFALRGFVTYLPIGVLQARVEPFRTLDRRYFAPLCLILAAGYLVIFLGL